MGMITVKLPHRTVVRHDDTYKAGITGPATYVAAHIAASAVINNNDPYI